MRTFNFETRSSRFLVRSRVTSKAVALLGRLCPPRAANCNKIPAVLVLHMHTTYTLMQYIHVSSSMEMFPTTLRSSIWQPNITTRRRPRRSDAVSQLLILPNGTEDMAASFAQQTRLQTEHAKEVVHCILNVCFCALPTPNCTRETQEGLDSTHLHPLMPQTRLGRVNPLHIWYTTEQNAETLRSSVSRSCGDVRVS